MTFTNCTLLDKNLEPKSAPWSAILEPVPATISKPVIETQSASNYRQVLEMFDPLFSGSNADHGTFFGKLDPSFYTRGLESLIYGSLSLPASTTPGTLAKAPTVTQLRKLASEPRSPINPLIPSELPYVTVGIPRPKVLLSNMAM